MIIDYSIFFLSYVCWFIALVGFGSVSVDFIKKTFHIDSDGEHLSLLTYGIAGMAVVTTLATLINFFMPISLTVTIVLLFFGIGLFFFNRKSILTYLSWFEKVLISTLALLIFMIIPFAWVSWFDTGMYHLPAIKWIIESQAPLGLANLHGRFGYNCSWFMLSACIDQWVIILNKPFFLVNGLIMFFYASAILLIVKRKIFPARLDKAGDISRHKGAKDKNIEIGLSDLFLIFSSIALVYPGLMMLTSSSPDLPVMIITLFVIYLAIYVLERTQNDNFYLFFAILLVAYAITIKLSSIALIVSLPVFLFQGTIESFKNKGKILDIFNDGMKEILNVLLLAILLLLTLPWMIRGLLLSGCLFFPFRIVYFSGLKWAVPPLLCTSEINWTTAWARLPSNDALTALSGWGWVKPWLERYFNIFGWSHMPLSRQIIIGTELDDFIYSLTQNIIISFIYPIAELVVPFIIFISGLLLIFYYIVFKKERLSNISLNKTACIIPMAISIIGIAFWFYSAPDLRFGIGFVYSLVLLTFSIPVYIYLFSKPRGQQLQTNVVQKRMKIIVIVLSAIILIYGSCIAIYYSTNTHGWGSDGFNFPQIQLDGYKTVDGTTIYISSGQYQLFWNGPLPNTPYFNASLRSHISNSTGLPDMFWYDDKNGLPIIL
ncbi:hypothetical protein MCP_0242 [Methanocella paludicola SANAE]|uniref:DUF8201 domain-containing protein n=1 Tax=Methanocella paludicola (strain DSM 17711 / JCM 13418 / NBRC 101707 / SANAE) TaxID=304371 RepID=D1YV42_METPS|nr:hypothetical protein MCP_0242 [Methanocella paludicola SANAE]